MPQAICIPTLLAAGVWLSLSGCTGGTPAPAPTEDAPPAARDASDSGAASTDLDAAGSRPAPGDDGVVSDSGGTAPDVGQGDPGVPVDVGEADPGAPVDVGEADPGAPVDVGEADPGAPVDVGGADPGAPVDVGEADPGVVTDVAPEDPGAAADHGPEDPGAGVADADLPSASDALSADEASQTPDGGAHDGEVTASDTSIVDAPELPEVEAGAACTDTVDNDNDGATDCDDHECATHESCYPECGLCRDVEAATEEMASLVGATVFRVHRLRAGGFGDVPVCDGTTAVDVDGDPATSSPSSGSSVDCRSGLDNQLLGLLLALQADSPEVFAATQDSLDLGEGNILLRLVPGEASGHELQVLSGAPDEHNVLMIGAGDEFLSWSECDITREDSCAFDVHASALAPGCDSPAVRLTEVSLAAGELTARSANGAIELPALGYPMRRAVLRAAVEMAGERVERIGPGVLAGVVERDDLPLGGSLFHSFLDVDTDGDGAADSMSVGLAFDTLPVTVGGFVSAPVTPPGCACHDDGSCPEEQVCRLGDCVGLHGCRNFCRPGESRCSGDGVQVCGLWDADACYEWGTRTPCGKLKVCVGGQCVPGCWPGTARCINATTVEICAASGTTFDAEVCPHGCRDDACSPCTPGALRCNPDPDKALEIQECGGDNSGWKDTGRTCEDICSEGRCTTLVCTPDALYCEGDDIVRCNGAGTETETETTCDFGCNTSAADGEPFCNLCEPGERRCAGADVEHCSDPSVGFESLGPCTGDLVCEAGFCVPIFSFAEGMSREAVFLDLTRHAAACLLVEAGEDKVLCYSLDTTNLALDIEREELQTWWCDGVLYNTIDESSLEELDGHSSL